MIYNKKTADKITKEGQKELRELVQAIGTGVGDCILTGKKKYPSIIMFDDSKNK